MLPTSSPRIPWSHLCLTFLLPLPTSCTTTNLPSHSPTPLPKSCTWNSLCPWLPVLLLPQSHSFFTLDTFLPLPLSVPQISTHHRSFWVIGPATSPIAIPFHQVKYGPVLPIFDCCYCSPEPYCKYLLTDLFCSLSFLSLPEDRALLNSTSSVHLILPGPEQALRTVWQVGGGRGEWRSFSHPYCSFRNLHCINEG